MFCGRVKRHQTVMGDSKSTLAKLRLESSREDVVSPGLWRGAIAEYVGTMLFVLVGCGSVAAPNASIVGIGLCFGLAIGTLVWIFGGTSGGHINPVVTLAMLLTRRISLVRALVYIVMQCLGGMAGAAIIRECLASVRSGFCVNGIGTNMTQDQGVVIEIVATSVLVLTIFAACDKARRDTGGSAALSIGIAVAVCHFAFIPLSGASMNPARSLGPAVMAGVYGDLWIYWAGPIIGSLLAAFSYEFFFCPYACVYKVRDFFVEADYDPDLEPHGREIVVTSAVSDEEADYK